MLSLSDQFKVGDIINVKGPTVPRDLLDKWFRVESVDGVVKLSRPFNDEACTDPYRPPVPRLNRS